VTRTERIRGPLVASIAMLRAFLDGAVFGTTAGTGPVRVVLLHGWRRTHGDFDAVAGRLADAGLASVAIDLPGFGATPPPASGTGARGYAASLVPMLDDLAADAGPVVVAGHSFGGRVAVCLAALRPAAVGAVVLSGVPLVRGAMPPAKPSRRYRLWRRAAAWHLVSERRLEAARRRYGSSDYRAATGVIRDVLVASINESYEAELASLECEADLVWGALDTTVPPAVALAAAAIAPRARVTVLDGVGHLVPTEAPEALADHVLAAMRSDR
jgi:pimeloyl-ACP methyl ester carboxylesterase